MKTAFEILPHNGKFALVRQPSGLILFTGTENACRSYFMRNKRTLTGMAHAIGLGETVSFA